MVGKQLWPLVLQLWRMRGGQCPLWSPADQTGFQASAKPFSSDLQHSHDFLKMAETRTSLFVSSLETSSSQTSNSGLMSIGILKGIQFSLVKLLSRVQLFATP